MICSKDDSGTTCENCTCMFNPVVLIATHERIEITTKNIELLKKQSAVPKIIVVCSLMEELIYYKTLQVNVVLVNNSPLGTKWQSGVNLAKNMAANPLIILGSDDILIEGFIERVLLKMKEGFEYIGLTTWFTYDNINNELFLSSYQGPNKDYPIGSGKVYSKILLDRFNWKVFNTKDNRRLDDQGNRMAEINGAKIFIIREPGVLAVKGNWVQLNPLRAYHTSPNISMERVELDELKKFGYVQD